MTLFYSILLKLYVFLIHVSAFFNAKAKLMLQGRKKLFDELKEVRKVDRKKIWVHCASLGEFEQARPLIEKINKEKPEIYIVLSFFSPSGYEIRKNYPLADHVCYIPFDSKKNAKKFIDYLEPEIAIFIKYEFWYHHIVELSNKKIPVYLVSAVFRESHMFFRWYGKFFKRMLEKYTGFFVQDERSSMILMKQGIKNVFITGDTRVDRVMEISSNEFSDINLDAFSKSRFTLVAGSTWPIDEKLLSKFLNMNNYSLNLIIAPHNVTESNINHIETLFDGRTIRYSKIAEITSKINVIIIDSVGILSMIYRFGDLAYIGGGFGRGIHNILEAAVYGIPVFFGPNHKKFIEAAELIDNGLAISVKNIEQLNKGYKSIVERNESKKVFMEISNNYFSLASGATSNIFRVIWEKMI